ncbi:uncharacterized protein LOC141614124 [Silene latifolia]|uniref:uncharacterized protein LOC141614124 n=1 Tax=Silene latifolia TaxID=37657 RepID=UPI003D774F36
MTGESGIILEIVKPINSFVFGSVTEYLGYIRSWEENLDSLRKNLSDVCNRKDDINKKVEEGKDKQEEISREAASWLKDVRILSEKEELKGLMYKDLETAKYVVKMMGKKHLKRRISKEWEMQEVVVKVMRKLKEEMEQSEEETRKMAEVDYKQVAEVVVEVMKDSIEEFKKLMKEDKNMAVIATRTLNDRDLDKLTKGDKEMEEIVREAGNVTDDEELWQNYEDEESNALLIKVPAEGVDKNRVKETARKLFLMTPLGKLMEDANFKKAAPEAELVKSRLDVIDGLLIKSPESKKEMADNNKQHRSCCGCTLSCCDYHGRYKISKAADLMAKHIKDDIVSKYPRDFVTMRIRTVDLKPIPTPFLKGFDSRTKLMHQILEKLKDGQVDAVGVFGMGGIGKTTLAKEVNRRAKDIFSLKVMVEVSDSPDIMRIQAAIAELIDLPLHDVKNVAQRAVILYNRLISEKEKKILVILDNVWKMLNLDEIGIPRSCKLLLTTREREVCRVMGVRDINILEVGVMDTNESTELFKSQAGNKVDVGEYKVVVERLLSNCGGLPLAIVATANSLKDKGLTSWEKFADDMEKPISSQVNSDYRQIYSILHTSYKFIEVDEKRIFFLLACLSPLGSSVSVKSLVRYGIGLNMFQYVNKLCEAIEQADKWSSELVLSSMLLEDDVKGSVKIHDIVRAFGISFAAKEEGHAIMVEAIPRWLDNETFKKYTAMSLMSRNEYTRLSGVEAGKLQILKLRGDLTPNFTDSFFKGMVNLEVLSLSDINLQPSLPESIGKLKRLKTLCMESCKLGDIKQVGELVNLLVLSLRESFVDELPNEIKELCELRLLDLSGCTSNKAPLIPDGILGSLAKLEGLYMLNNRQAVFETKSVVEGTSYVNNGLPYLNVLEIKVDKIEHLLIDALCLKNLDKFRVIVGKQWATKTEERHKQYSRVLEYKDIADRVGVLENGCLKVLLEKADCLRLEDCKKFENLVPELDQEGFRDVSSLYVHHCCAVKCIVKGHGTNDLIPFPRLVSLELSQLWELKMVCDGTPPPGMFSNLQTLKLGYVHKLTYVLPLALLPRNLKLIDVIRCDSLEFVFMEDEETHVIELPFLESLKLCSVPKFLSLVGPKKFSATGNDDSQGCQIFFDEKIICPSLKLLSLECCYNVEKLWSNGVFIYGFQNLKDIMIKGCKKLLSVGSSSLFSVFVQLETLRIVDCSRMREVITVEEIEGSERGEPVIRFPHLKYLELGDLGDLQSFCGGGSKLEFPKLKKLQLFLIGQTSRLAKLDDSSDLFHEKIDFPCLEELRSVKDEVRGLWDWKALRIERGRVTSSPAPMLRQLTLCGKGGLQQIGSLIFKNLVSLTLTELSNDDVLFSSKEGYEWTNTQLPKLEELKVKRSKSLKELFANEACNELTSFCGQLKTLELFELPTLNLVPLHLFKGLTSLILHELKWNYVISADTLSESLRQLQILSIDACEKMEAIVINVGLVIEFPRLKKLRLNYLNSVKNVFSPSKSEATLRLPSLESLEINLCKKLEPFWSGFIVAPRLEDIRVTDCENMQHFLVGNQEHTIELPSLQKMNIQSCHGMTSISSRPLDVPKLRDVLIIKCSWMQCFLPGYPNLGDDIQLPLLESLYIDRCPRLHSFSLGRLLTPKLTSILFVKKEYSALQFDNLNDFIKEIREDRQVKLLNSLM